MSAQELRAKIECLDTEALKSVAKKLNLTKLNDTALRILRAEVERRRLNGTRGVSQAGSGRKP